MQIEELNLLLRAWGEVQPSLQAMLGWYVFGLAAGVQMTLRLRYDERFAAYHGRTYVTVRAWLWLLFATLCPPLSPLIQVSYWASRR